MNEMRKYIELIDNANRPKMSLQEGVKFGSKQKNQVMNNDKIRVGIEYEFWAKSPEQFYVDPASENSINDMENTEYIEYALSDYDWVEFNDIENYNPYTEIYNINDILYYYSGKWYSEDLTSEDLESYDVLNVILEFVLSTSSKHPGVLMLASVERFYDMLEALADILETGVQLDSIIEKDHIRKLSRYTNVDYTMSYYEVVNHIQTIIKTPMFSVLDQYFTDKAGIPSFNDYAILIDKLLNKYVTTEQTAEELFDLIENESEYYDDIEDAINDIINDSIIFEIASKLNLNITVAEQLNKMDNADLPNIDHVEKERDGQIEIITVPMTLHTAFENLDYMLSVIADNGETTNASGMHVSLSSSDWEKRFNIEKFLILLNIDSIHRNLFSSRTHVEDFNNIVRNKLFINSEKIANYVLSSVRQNNSSMLSIIDEIYRIINMTEISKNKFQSINLRDYEKYEGRVELRYFGGKDYHLRGEEIKNEILRAAYILDIAYGDLYDKEYQKYRYIYMDKLFENTFGHGVTPLVKAASDIRHNPEKAQFYTGTKSPINSSLAEYF